jgi:hypothetical protein
VKATYPHSLAGLALLFVLAAAPRSVQASTYQIDDGISEDSVGLGNGGDLIALNQFNVTPGNSMIGSVSIAWGTPINPDPTLNGLSYTVVIWADPNSDGDPGDAFVLAMAPAVISNANTDTFVTTLFPCITVTPSFFVGFIISQNAGQFPIAFDQSAPLSGRSFVAGSFSMPGDINNLNNNDIPVGAIESFGLSGNFLIRADPCAAVPEPSITALALVGGLAVLIGYRHKFRVLPNFRVRYGRSSGNRGTIFVGTGPLSPRRAPVRPTGATLSLPSTHRHGLHRSFASRKPCIHLKHAA